MKSAPAPSERPRLIAALDRAIAPAGTSALGEDVPAALWRRALAGPAAELLARPGKQLRAVFVRAGWTLGGGRDAPDDRLPLVLELLHAGSLIIDDVEDGSVERRGAPALHQLVGVPLAINTGSWMYFWALAELAEIGLPPDVELAATRAAITTLVRCHQGQALDLSVRIIDEHADVPAVVAATTRLKTGALCRFATELGAIAAGAPAAQRDAIAAAGEQLGIGLQMLDDLGSLTCAARRAKGHEDLRAGRPTWPWAWLAAHRPFAWTRLTQLVRAATSDAELDAVADALVAEVDEVGRAAIRGTLDTALAALVHVGTSHAVDDLAAEIARMVQSYG